MITRLPARILATALLAGTLALLPACRGSSTYALAASTPVGAFGPRVRVANQSDITLRVRYWVARVDTREPIGFTDQRTHPRLEVLVHPGDDFSTVVGRSGWVTANHDAVIWARFQPVALSPEGQTPIGDPIWYELSRPGPYHIVVTGSAFPTDPAMPAATLAFQPANDQTGSLTPLPRSMWIEQHDGFFPITQTHSQAANP